MPLYIASGILTVGEGSLLVLISPYLDSRGVQAGVIGLVLSSYGVASFICRIPAGAAYRSSRGPWLVAGGCLVMAAAFFLIPTSGNPFIVGGLVALDGMGFAVATTGAMAALMERRPPGSGAGSIMGWYTGSIGAGYAVAGFVAGGLADRIGIERAIAVMALVPLLAGSRSQDRSPVERRRRRRAALDCFVSLPAPGAQPLAPSASGKPEAREPPYLY